MSFSDTPEAQKLMSLRKMRLVALGILQGANNAHIPEKWQRLNRETFRGYLSKEYHDKDINNIVSLIYDDRSAIFHKLPFILIDGGDADARSAAGCAILFRLISYGCRGLVKSCAELVRKTQMMDYTEEMNRNALTDMLKENVDALFISEFGRTLFKGHLQEAQFFDEILGMRSDNLLTTIISYTQPFGASEIIKDSDCGQYLQKLSFMETVDPNPSKDCLRIRVRKI